MWDPLTQHVARGKCVYFGTQLPFLY